VSGRDVPAGIDPHEVETCLAGQPGVREVHDLHIRAMSTTGTALTAHLVRDAGTEDGLLDRMRRELHDRFGIERVTFQSRPATLRTPCRRRHVSCSRAATDNRNGERTPCPTRHSRGRPGPACFARSAGSISS
jgi:hypothetical protein